MTVTQFLMGVGGGSDVNTSGERHLVRTLTTVAEPPYRVFDVGANTGQFLTMLLGNVDAALLEVHCFEPSPDAFAMLAHVAADHPSVRINNTGLGSEPGEMLLYYDRPGSPLASLTRRRLEHFQIPFEMSEPVSINSVDAYCREQGIQSIDWLKIDVEGHELDVLAGAEEMLARHSIALVTFEFGGCNIDSRSFVQDFFYIFRAASMDLYRLTPSGYLSAIADYREIYEQFLTSNFVAIRRVVALKH
jgi:FkbM family methyltransferase